MSIELLFVTGSIIGSISIINRIGVITTIIHTADGQNPALPIIRNIPLCYQSHSLRYRQTPIHTAPKIAL